MSDELTECERLARTFDKWSAEYAALVADGIAANTAHGLSIAARNAERADAYRCAAERCRDMDHMDP